EAYRLTRKDGAPGIDGVMADAYARNLEANLLDLLDRIKTGRYQAPPVRRTYIPKADGSRDSERSRGNGSCRCGSRHVQRQGCAPIQYDPEDRRQMGRSLLCRRRGWLARSILKTPFIAKPNPACHSRRALDRVAQIAERKYCRPQARPFRLGFPRKVPVFPICPPTALQALRRARPSALAAVNLATAIRHGCRSAGLACPLGSSTAAASSVRPNQ